MAYEDPEFTKKIKDKVEKWHNYFRDNNENYHWFFEFILGSKGQWDEEETKLLEGYKKSALQFNKLATLINTLLGEQQQNTPQLEVYPLEDADPQDVETRDTIVKDISLGTEAKRCYQNAAKQAFVGGFGSYALDRDYEHNKSFDQEIKFKIIKDPTKCHWDISAELDDKTDGQFSGYIERVSRNYFKSKFGEEIEEKISGDDGTNPDLNEQPKQNQSDEIFVWADADTIAIVHHYERKYEDQRLFKFSDGTVYNEDEFKNFLESSQDRKKQIDAMRLAQGEYLSDEEFEYKSADELYNQIEESEDDNIKNIEVSMYDKELNPIRLEGSRVTQKCIIKEYLVADTFVLDETEFPSEDLPVIFVDQNSYIDKKGKQICRPFLVDAVDTQKYINYLGTQTAYMLKMSRYDQFMGPSTLTKSSESKQIWSDPQSWQGLLTYDKTRDGDKPEQIRPPELPNSLIEQYKRAEEDLYTCTGLYPTRMGDQGNEQSGKAIDARTRQGSYPTYVAFNAINRAITAGGKIVNQMIPRVYDTPRTMSLVTSDKGRQNVKINQPIDGYENQYENDVTKGTYEVMLKAGPSYEGQKQQALDSLNMVLQASPQLLNLFADLYAENLPLSNTTEIKNRLKTIVPKDIIKAGKTGEMPQEKQEPSAAEKAQMAEIKYKQEQIEVKKQELQLKAQELQSKQEQERIKFEIQKLESASEIEAAKLRYLAETDRTASQNSISHADNLTDIITTEMKESKKMGY